MSTAQKPKLPESYGFFIILFLVILLLGGCFHRVVHDGPPHYYVDMTKVHNPVPRYLPKSRYGNAKYYWIAGRRYHVLESSHGYNKRGIASWYGTKFDGKLTSTREKYSLLDMTAASPELPIPCYVRVTNLENGRQVIVKVNDRGPFAANRIMDLSYVAARKLGYVGHGTALVQVTSIDMPNPLAQTRRDFATHRPQLYLQVGAFAIPRNAERLEASLRHITSRPIRIVHDTPHSRLYRVQIGPLRDVSESDYLENKILHAGLGRAMTVIS